MCGRIGETHHITTERTSGHGEICCLKKFFAGTNKHYCVNANNTVAKTMHTLKYWLE
jgi:hypothetical protein